MALELNLYMAVTRARAAIRFGVNAREACMIAAEKFNVPVERVSRLAYQAELACGDAREQLVIAQRLAAGPDPLADAFNETRQDRNRPGRPTKSSSAAADLARLFEQKNLNPTAGVSMSGFAKILGRSPSYVTGLKQDGRLVMLGERHVDVEASLARIEQTALDRPA